MPLLLINLVGEGRGRLKGTKVVVGDERLGCFSDEGIVILELSLVLIEIYLFHISSNRKCQPFMEFQQLKLVLGC